MHQLWTIIFVILLGGGYGLASWHDRDKVRRREQREAACRKHEHPDG